MLLGRHGEDLATSFYVKMGFHILEKNYRHGRSEMDLIIQKGDELMVFVEVKSRANNNFGFPEIFVSQAQKKRLVELADYFVHENNWIGKIRFDIISIIFKKNNPPIIDHFEDAFY